VELPPAFRNFEPAVRDLLEAMVAGELIGALARNEHVTILVEQPPREGDRGAGGPEAGNGASGAGTAVHDRCIELDAAVRRQYASASGVEALVLLENAHRGLDRVERSLALVQDLGAGGQRRFESRARALLLLGIEPTRAHRARPAVHHQPPSPFRHSAPLAARGSLRQLSI